MKDFKIAEKELNDFIDAIWEVHAIEEQRQINEKLLRIEKLTSESDSVKCPQCAGTGNPCSSNIIAICDKCKGTGKI